MSPYRILMNCESQGECRLWKGGLGGRGYPYVWSRKQCRSVNARKVIWRKVDPTPVPPTHRIVMTCRNKLCLNCDHMALMTRQESSAFAADGGAYSTVRRLISNAMNARKNSKIGSLERAQELRLAVQSKQLTVQQAAVVYGAHERVVQKIVKGDRWVPRLAPNCSVFHQSA
jgi:hypothetical protein